MTLTQRLEESVGYRRFLAQYQDLAHSSDSQRSTVPVDLITPDTPGSVNHLQTLHAAVAAVAYAEADRPYDKRNRFHVSRLCKIESLQRPERRPAEGQVVDGASVGVGEGDTVEKATQVMPGVLLRPDNEPTIRRVNKTMAGTTEEKMALSNTGVPHAQPRTNGVKLTNGVLPSNGVEADREPSDGVQDQANPINGVERLLDGQLPPELEHVTIGCLSLSSLLSRLAQDTINDLSDTIDRMSDIKFVQASGSSAFSGSQMNGIGGGDRADANVQKKELLLQFGLRRRHQFVKALVVSQWSRQTEQVGKCIDLLRWMENRTGRETLEKKDFLHGALWWVGQLKVVVEHTKMRNPDLKTALETLSLGKASWLTDVRQFLERGGFAN